MSKRHLLNIILVLILAGLIILTIYEPGRDKTVPDVTLTTLNQSDIHKIIIEQPGQQTIVLKKKLDTWNIYEPFSISANQAVVKNILELMAIRSHAQYSASTVELAKLNLTNPALIIHINDATLSFGDTDALNGYRYILIDDRIHLITDRLSHILRGNITSIVNTSPLPDKSSISSLYLPGLTLELNNDVWSTLPNNQSISGDDIQKLLDEWRFARALQVKVISDENGIDNNINKNAIKITTTDGKIFHFNAIQTNDELILYRHDIGLQYHFDKNSADRLLNIQKSSPEFIKPE